MMMIMITENAALMNHALGGLCLTSEYTSVDCNGVYRLSRHDEGKACVRESSIAMLKRLYKRWKYGRIETLQDRSSSLHSQCRKVKTRAQAIPTNEKDTKPGKDRIIWIRRDSSWARQTESAGDSERCYIG